MKKFKKLLVCMLAVMMLISSAIPVSAATRPAIPTLRSAQMTSSGRMSLSWKSVSNADGYKVRIYNCSKRKHLPFISVEGTTTTIIQTNVRTQLILYPYTATDG